MCHDRGRWKRSIDYGLSNGKITIIIYNKNYFTIYNKIYRKTDKEC